MQPDRTNIKRLRNRFILIECIAGLLVAILHQHGINAIPELVVWTLVLLLVFAWQMSGKLLAELDDDDLYW